MGKYTMELRKVCDYYTREIVESWFKDYQLSDYLTQTEIDSINTTNIWSKDRLASKIVDHYFMREIGFETPALFEHFVKIKMKEIMERKLPFIYSQSLKYEPLTNVNFDITETRKIVGEGNSTNNGTSSSSDSGLAINNDTPQTKITKQDLETGAYASNVNQSDSSATTSTTNSAMSDTTTNETFSHHEEGNSGISATYQKMVQQFRDNIYAVDESIIQELDILFMGLY